MCKYGLTSVQLDLERVAVTAPSKWQFGWVTGAPPAPGGSRAVNVALCLVEDLLQTKIRPCTELRSTTLRERLKIRKAKNNLALEI